MLLDVTAVDWSAVDEDEGEAVALATLEFLFAEANAVHRQHCLNRKAVG